MDLWEQCDYPYTGCYNCYIIPGYSCDVTGLNCYAAPWYYLENGVEPNLIVGIDFKPQSPEDDSGMSVSSTLEIEFEDDSMVLNIIEVDLYIETAHTGFFQIYLTHEESNTTVPVFLEDVDFVNFGYSVEYPLRFYDYIGALNATDCDDWLCNNMFSSNGFGT